MNFKFLGNAFVISALFPFFGIPSIDSQPFPFFFGLVFIVALLISGRSFLIPKNIIFNILFLFLGCITAILVDGRVSYLTARAVLGYAAIPIYYLGFANYLRVFGFPKKLINLTLIIWICVGLIQIFEPNFVSSFVALRTTPERGVTSLAPEPTYFAIYLFFLCWLVLINSNYRLNLNTLIPCLLGLMGMLLLARSSMCVLYLATAILFIFLRLITEGKYKLVFSITLVSIILISVVLVFLPADSRMFQFFSSFATDGAGVFLRDKSSNERISSIILPLIALWNHHLLPVGFTSYSWEAGIVAESLWPIFPHELFEKIMSWNMAMWYELGFFGIAGWLSLLLLARLRDSREALEFCLLFTLLFSAIPHLFPLPVMLMALIRHRRMLEYRA